MGLNYARKEGSLSDEALEFPTLLQAQEVIRRASPLRILVLNGTSLAAVQFLNALDPATYEIDVCDSNPLCWCRFHTRCAHFYLSPNLSSEPRSFYEFVLDRLDHTRYDVLLPVHEEGLVLAKYGDAIRKRTHLLLGDVLSYHTILNKVLCLEHARSIGVPIPDTYVARSVADVASLGVFPCYVKSPYGTSSSGVARFASADAAGHVSARFPGASELIVQRQVDGDLCVTQSVFVAGRMIAVHQYQAEALGYGGGASRRLGIAREDMVEFASRFGSSLSWSGPLMLDFMVDRATGSPYLIDGNPRLGETFHAALSGVNLCEVVVQASLGQMPRSVLRSKPGRRSHQLFTETLRRVRRGDPLGLKLAGAIAAMTRSGTYGSSVDELIHPRTDPVSALATAALLVGLPILNRGIARRLNGFAVASMSASPGSVRTILESHWDAGPRVDPTAVN